MAGVTTSTEQRWRAVSDGTMHGTMHIECERCGYVPREVITAADGCPRCTPVYEALEALQSEVARIAAAIEPLIPEFNALASHLNETKPDP